jgi:hypothetical protein
MDVLTASVFCQNLIASCSTIPGVPLPSGYTTPAMCEASYTASTQQHCQSYHLCAGVEGITMPPGDPTTHCPLAGGQGICSSATCTANGPCTTMGDTCPSSSGASCVCTSSGGMFHWQCTSGAGGAGGA